MNSAIPTSEQVAELERVVLTLLMAAPNGLSEHQLLKCLRQRHALFATFNPREPLSLFRGHFLLFHVLYRLRDRLRQQQGSDLIIDPLCIVLLTVKGAAVFLAKPGALIAAKGDDARVWYSDLTRWTAVTGADVIALLRQFPLVTPGNKQRQAALDILGLQDPVDERTIKQRYRSLAQRYHPDRGGDGGQLCRIHQALKTLQIGSRRIKQNGQ